MLSWSLVKYKLTLGIGSLAITGLICEYWQPLLSVWVVLPIALFPLAAFVFFYPEDWPTQVVRLVHIAGALWYWGIVVGLLVALVVIRPRPADWPMYLSFLAVGAIPCSLVLYRAARGRYPPPETLQSQEEPLL